MKLQSVWNRRVASLLLAASLGAIAACAESTPEAATPEAVTPEAEPAAVTASEPTAEADSAAATESEPIETAKSVVTLTSLTADLIHTLDAEKLVAIPGSSLLREDDRFAGLEAVSEGRAEPNLEQIVALEPDLVVGATGFHDKALEKLEELGVATLSVDVSDWDSLRSIATDLAQRLGADPQPLLDRFDACLAKAPETNPSALVLVSRQPLLSPNQDSWAGDFLAQFNVTNVTAELQGESPFDGYVTLSEEKVLTSNPEALLVVETGEGLLDQLKGDAFWGELEATKTEAVYTFDYHGLVNPGSVASIEAVCDRLSQL
ncbi:MAG: ABC transporter substrate-binding protein [Geitlerinemataceae cyanobacterium]